MIRTFALALVAAGLFACSSPCLQIQQAICECQGQTQNERNACEDAASAQEKLAPPDEAQLAACQELLPQCEQKVQESCETLKTRDGRVACGITPK